MLPDHYQDKTWGSCDSVKELLTGAPEAVRMTPLSSGGAMRSDLDPRELYSGIAC
jgi:hypothetical protein